MAKNHAHRADDRISDGTAQIHAFSHHRTGKSARQQTVDLDIGGLPPGSSVALTEQP